MRFNFLLLLLLSVESVSDNEDKLFLFRFLDGLLWVTGVVSSRNLMKWNFYLLSPYLPFMVIWNSHIYTMFDHEIFNFFFQRSNIGKYFSRMLLVESNSSFTFSWDWPSENNAHSGFWILLTQFVSFENLLLLVINSYLLFMVILIKNASICFHIEIKFKLRNLDELPKCWFLKYQWRIVSRIILFYFKRNMLVLINSKILFKFILICNSW